MRMNWHFISLKNKKEKKTRKWIVPRRQQLTKTRVVVIIRSVLVGLCGQKEKKKSRGERERKKMRGAHPKLSFIFLCRPGKESFIFPS